jgi:hypothetical protein
VKNAATRLAAAALLVAAVGACSGGAAGTQPPATPVAFAIKTAPAVAQACMDALAGGKLAPNDLSGLGIASADGQAMPVEWPFGYKAWIVEGRAVLVDETGKIVAKVGDEVTVGGGFGNVFWHACGGVTVTKPAS